MKAYIYILSSLFLVAFGQSSFVPFFAVCSASFGYALFWFGLLKKFQQGKTRFWIACLWFFFVQAIQLSWFLSYRYMGPAILIVYALLVFVFSLQFGALIFFFKREKGNFISLRNCFAIAGAWALLEWSRLFIFSGFPWNPAALSLGSSNLSIQFAAVFGVYGLSFWVFFVNAFGLYSINSWKKGSIWAVLALFPYLYGQIQQTLIEKNVPIEKELSVCLVQTGILPEEKDRYQNHLFTYIPPLNQWERIWNQLVNLENVDLIVFPETAVALIADAPYYPLAMVEVVWEDYFGKIPLKNLPPLEAPYATFCEKKGWKVSNLFLAQLLANHFNAEIITGFVDKKGGKEYNSAYGFEPFGIAPISYEKRVLIPMGEYVPFANSPMISGFLQKQFGLGDSFARGSDAKLFSPFFPTGVSICLEETYSHLTRDLRKKGAKLFVNISNDVWFPGSHLPEQHFQHGRIRSAENGVFSLRSCNTGITGVVDCFGRAYKTLAPSENAIETLYLKVPVRSFPTPYLIWGDAFILFLSFLFATFPFIYRLF